MMTRLLYIFFILACINGTFGDGLKCKFTIDMRIFSLSASSLPLLPLSRLSLLFSDIEKDFIIRCEHRLSYLETKCDKNYKNEQIN